MELMFGGLKLTLTYLVKFICVLKVIWITMTINLKSKNHILVSSCNSYCFVVFPIIIYGMPTMWFNYCDCMFDKVYSNTIGNMKNYDR